MISTPPAELQERAQAWADHLRSHSVSAKVEPAQSTVGGGSLPGETLPTYALAVAVDSPDALAETLRASDPPVIGRIENDQLLLDPRTVLPEQDQQLLDILTEAISHRSAAG